jgi:hypothetical protein
MMRSFLFILLLLLPACTTNPFSRNLQPSPLISKPPEAERFLAALEHLSTTNSIAQLERFRQKNPSSIWARQAENLINLVQAGEHCASLRVAEQQEKSQLEAEQERLQQENLQLSETIDKLKVLLIELEGRAQ